MRWCERGVNAECREWCKTEVQTMRSIPCARDTCGKNYCSEWIVSNDVRHPTISIDWMQNRLISIDWLSCIARSPAESIKVFSFSYSTLFDLRLVATASSWRRCRENGICVIPQALVRFTHRNNCSIHAWNADSGQAIALKWHKHKTNEWRTIVPMGSSNKINNRSICRRGI